MNGREVALITGASMGIGKELAKVFATEGHDLVLVARSEDKLRSLGQELERTHGITAHVVRAELPLPHQLDMLKVNVDALVALTHLGLQGMLARKKGRILNIASLASFQPGPDMSVYYATKAFVLMFSEGIAEEVKGSGVTVTVHCPGAVATNFGETARNATSLYFRLGTARPDKVARHAYRSMMKGKVVAIEGLKNCLGAFSVRFGPRALVRKITRWLNQTP